MNRYWTTTLVCAIIIALSLQQGCFRKAVLRMKNDKLEGKPAPALTSLAWVLPDGQPQPPKMQGNWVLLGFFKPT